MNTELKLLISEVKEAVQTSLLDEKNLWDSNRVAQYHGYSTPYFKRAIATLTGFPKPIIMPVRGNGGRERYEPKDIKQWAKRYQA